MTCAMKQNNGYVVFEWNQIDVLKACSARNKGFLHHKVQNIDLPNLIGNFFFHVDIP